MRILHIINSLHPSNGGPVEGIREMSLEQTRQGHTAHVLSLDAPASPGHERFHSEIIALGPSGPSPFCLNFRLVPWLSRHRENYDAILLHGIWDFSTLGAWLALRGGQTPFFVYAHGMLDPWFRKSPLGWLKKSAYWLLAGQHIFRSAAGILYITEAERKLASQAFWPYHCTELISSHGTARPAAAEYRAAGDFFAAYPELQNKRILLYLGRVHPKKGLDILLDAFAIASVTNPDIHLVIAGGGNPKYVQHLNATAREAEMQERITWTGYLSDHLRAGALAAADGFTLPSHGDNFALSAVEALARGVPLLLSRRVNIADTVLRERAGFVGDDTVQGTLETIQNWADSSVSARAELRRQARHCYEKHWQIEQVCARIMTLLANQHMTPEARQAA